MKTPHLVLLVAVLLLTTAMPARADFFVTPFFGLKFAGNTSIVDLDLGASNTKMMFGVAVSLLGDGIVGVEADVGYVPRFFERSSGTLIASSQVFTLMGNVILMPPRELTGYSLRPFISGGGGLISVDIDDISGVIPVDSNLFGINIGGGAMGGLTNRTDIRFDLRYFKSISQEDEASVDFFRTSLSFWRAAVGITLR